MATRKKRRKAKKKTVRRMTRSKSIGQLVNGSARKVGRTARKLANKAISKIRSLSFV